jgi:hypothetical protein
MNRKVKMASEENILLCYQCGNTTPHTRIGYFLGKGLYEETEEQKHHEDREYFVFQCPTCQGISIYGDWKDYSNAVLFSEKLLYPKGPNLVPEAHKVASRGCIPARIIKIYEEIWPLRHIAPNAFSGQIRRSLEMVCADQKAIGKTLFDQLRDLTNRGIFPGNFAEITDLIRKLGNLGAHAGEEDVDYWDAELLDDFFRSVIEYVYIAPSKILRMKQRLELKGKGP